MSRSDLNELTRRQLGVARRNWNRRHGGLARLEGYEGIGTISTVTEGRRVRKWVLDNLILPDGDLADRDRMTLVAPRSAKARRAFGGLLAEVLVPGAGAVRLDWNAGGRQFSTLAVVNLEGIAFDTMLSNTFMVRSEPVPAEMHMSDCKSHSCLWIWGSERGRCTGCVWPYCDTSPPTCGGSATGGMSVGDYISRLLPFPPSAIGNCCTATWVWALMTPLVSGKVVISPSGSGVTIDIQFSGVGSRFGGTETLRDCCPAPPPPPPPSRPPRPRPTPGQPRHPRPRPRPSEVRGACELTSFTAPANRSGCVNEPRAGGRRKAGEKFDMQAKFAGTCSCCEYRQYVRGSVTINGQPVNVPLPGPGGGPPITLLPRPRPGDPPDPEGTDNFREDGLVNPGPNSNAHYGHRDEDPPGNADTTDRYLAQRADGCEYAGNDFPGITSAPGTTYVMDVDFLGRIVDTCNGGRVVAERTWTVTCQGTL